MAPPPASPDDDDDPHGASPGSAVHGAALDDDAERTRVPGPISFDAARREGALGTAQALPAGTRLGEFEVVEVLGQGGFSMVYVALDHSLGRRIALKEYFPASIAARAHGALQVHVTSPAQREAFDLGLRSFVNEAHLLARFDHPALAKVHRFWQAHGTAYMVMPLYEGLTLKARLRTLPAPPDEAWLRALLDPLTDALAVLHDAHCLHRDVAPDNILLLADDRPLLLDFGAARQVVAGATQALTAILKPGYAPVEQYAEMPDLQQGPWTDVYALAAMVHTAITGHPPPPSVSRLVRDTCEPLAVAAAGRFSARFLQAIDRALSVQPRDRPPSMAALREALALERLPARASASFMDAGVLPRLTGEPAPAGAPAAPAAPPARAHTRWMAWSGAGVAACAALLALGWQLRADRATPTAAATVPARSADTAAPAGAAHDAPPPAAPLGVAPAGPRTTQEAVTAAASGIAPPAPRAAQETPPAAPTSAFAPARAGGVAGALDELQQAQDPGFGVVARPASARLRVDRDPLHFSVSSAVDGHVYVLLHGPDDSLLLLFPNRAARDNRIRAGQTLRLPQAAWPLVARAPTGPERFLVVVTPAPRDLAALAQGHAGAFARLPTADALDAVARRLRPEPYGAASFRIDVVP